MNYGRTYWVAVCLRFQGVSIATPSPAVTSDGRIKFDVGLFKRAPLPSVGPGGRYNILQSLSSPLKAAAAAAAAAVVRLLPQVR
jgi:hypothetical protein